MSRIVMVLLYFISFGNRLTEDILVYLSRDGPLPDRLSFRGAPE